MGNWATAETKYTRAFDAVLNANPGWTDLLVANTGANPTDMGAYSVPVTTAVTLQSPADGTILPNNAAQTLTGLTAFEFSHTISLRPLEKGVFNPSYDAAQFRAFVNAARNNAAVQVITDLVAGTASGGASALPTGQLNFYNDGTDAEVRLATAAIDEAFAELKFSCQGLEDEGSLIFGLTTSTGAKNLLSLMEATRGAALIRSDDAGRLYWRGHRIFVSDVTVSGYGAAASADAMYWIHPDAEPLIYVEANASSDGLVYCEDNRWKKIYNGYGYAGLVQAAKYATVSNGTS